MIWSPIDDGERACGPVTEIGVMMRFPRLPGLPAENSLLPYRNSSDGR